MKPFNEKRFYYRNTFVHAYYYENRPGFRVSIYNSDFTRWIPLHFEKLGSYSLFWTVIKKAIKDINERSL